MKLKKRYIILLLLIILISLGGFIYSKIHNKNGISYITTKQKKLGSENNISPTGLGNYKLLDDEGALILIYGDYTVKVIDSYKLKGEGYTPYMGFEFFFCRPKEESEDGGCDSWDFNGTNGIYKRLGQSIGNNIILKVKKLYEEKYEKAKNDGNYYLAKYWVEAYDTLVNGHIDSKIINEVPEPKEENRCTTNPFGLSNNIIWQDPDDPKRCVGYFDSPDYPSTVYNGWGATYEDFKNNVSEEKMMEICNILRAKATENKTSGPIGSYNTICAGVKGYSDVKLDYFLDFDNGYWLITIKDTTNYGISYEEFVARYGEEELVTLRQLLIADMAATGHFNADSIQNFNKLEYNQNHPENQIPITTQCSTATHSEWKNHLNFYVKKGYAPIPKTFQDQLESDIEHVKDVCGCTFIKNQLLQPNAGSLEQIDSYNKACDDKIQTSTITLNWHGGEGPTSLSVNWDGGWGIYKITGIVGTTKTVVFDSPLHLMNHNLIGWSTSKDCTTKIGSGGLSHSFEFGADNITYYACYEGDIYEGTLFSGGNKITGTTTYTYENKTCDTSKSTTGNLTSVPQKRLSRYTKQTYETVDSISTAGNKYCNVICTDTIDVKYPNIFETIPAGQYFELLYEPEILASRTCQAQLNSIDWSAAYQQAISAEVDALNAYEEAKAQYNATVALSPQASSSKNCDPYQCGTIEHPRTCYSSYTYSDTKSVSFKDARNGYDTTKTASFSACNSTDTSSLVNSAKDVMDSKKALYETAISKRVTLEKQNLQCFTLLDSDKSNNVSTRNKEVFNENYKLLNELNPSYKTETEKVVISEDVATNDVYKSYITSETGIRNDVLTSFSGNTINTKNFFYMYPTINLSYDPGNTDGKPTTNESNYIKDTLLAEAHVKLDTGSYTTIDDSGYKKVTSTGEISREFWVNGVKGTYIKFPYYSTETRRQVKYYFTYHEGTEYCSKNQTGSFKDLKELHIPKCNQNNEYVSLSKKTKYKVGTTDSEIEVSNNVYPVSIKATTNKYNISFKLGDKSGTNYLRNNFSSGSTFKYTCDYEITNDVLITLGGDYTDLKNNTIFRSVALGTDSSGSTLGKLDPNNRSASSNFGENWLNPKGQAVAKEINAEENTTTSYKNTYNPENLEYSFTLTPSLIAAIKEYNEDNPYDDYNLVCKTADGRECVSKFLENLAKGQVKNGGTDYCIGKNCSQVTSNSEDLLNKSRKNWKYYYYNEYTKTGSIKEVNTLSLEDYTKFYSKWGVLQ